MSCSTAPGEGRKEGNRKGKKEGDREEWRKGEEGMGKMKETRKERGKEGKEEGGGGERRSKKENLFEDSRAAIVERGQKRQGRRDKRGTEPYLIGMYHRRRSILRGRRS